MQFQVALVIRHIFIRKKHSIDFGFLTQTVLFITIQCPSLNRITLSQHRSDNNNRMIQLTDAFCVLLRYNGTSNIWLQYAADSIIRDPIKRRCPVAAFHLYWNKLKSKIRSCLYGKQHHWFNTKKNFDKTLLIKRWKDNLKIRTPSICSFLLEVNIEFSGFKIFWNVTVKFIQMICFYPYIFLIKIFVVKPASMSKTICKLRPCIPRFFC